MTSRVDRRSKYGSTVAHDNSHTLHITSSGTNIYAAL